MVHYCRCGTKLGLECTSLLALLGLALLGLALLGLALFGLALLVWQLTESAESLINRATD